MTVARSKGGAWSRVHRLPAGKGSEVIGLALLSAGLILLCSLISYHPADPSLLHRTTAEVATQNWIGPFGAELSAVSLTLFGLPTLLVPLVLLFVGYRRFRRRENVQIVGRGFGLGMVLFILPALTYTVLGTIGWRGEGLESGGVFGEFIAQTLRDRLGAVGSLVIQLTVLFLGTALAVPSGLDEVAADTWRRLRGSWAMLTERFSSYRSERERSRSRQRVVDKHRTRRKEALGQPATSAPLRVQQREGKRAFGIRRVEGAPPGYDDTGDVAPPPAALLDDAAGETFLEAPTATPTRAPARRRTPKKAAKPRQEKLALSVKPGTLPPINLLELKEEDAALDESQLLAQGEMIRSRCAEFGVQGTVEGISPGPVITTFEFQPAPGVKVSQIVNLQDDLALALKAESVRIDRIPGRSTLGVEVPNADRQMIRLGRLFAADGFKKADSPLTVALGRTVQGEPYFGDLAKMPHLLVAGATGAGKSVGLQGMITSILYRATREQVQFIFIDPKRIELGVYGDIPHLKTEVVVEPKKAANALRWAVREMERRYKLLAEVHVRSIDFYNRAISDPEVQKRLALREEEAETEVDLSDLSPLPYYVIVIDELADLMMVSSSDVESSIARLAQMARAVGIHLIVATQRPSVDVLTGTIKANFPTRISYATATRHDSRTILDQVGAERLLGKGDALFMPPGSSRTVRLHGAYVSEQETAALVRWLKRQGRPDLDLDVLEAPPEERKKSGDGADNHDELFDEAARLVVSEGSGSASFLQRRMRIGFSRASRLIDMMEQDGILGPAQGSKPRDILVKPDFFEEVDDAPR